MTSVLLLAMTRISLDHNHNYVKTLVDTLFALSPVLNARCELRILLFSGDRIKQGISSVDGETFYFDTEVGVYRWFVIRIVTGSSITLHRTFNIFFPHQVY